MAVPIKPAEGPKGVSPLTDLLPHPHEHYHQHQVYVKGVYPASGEYSLTFDPEMTEEKARALNAEREVRRAAMKKKQEVDKLLIGESRKGVITKVSACGCGKVDRYIGVSRTH